MLGRRSYITSRPGTRGPSKPPWRSLGTCSPGPEGGLRVAVCSSTAVERLFSIASDVLRAKQTSLTSENLKIDVPQEEHRYHTAAHDVPQNPKGDEEVVFTFFSDFLFYESFYRQRFITYCSCFIYQGILFNS